MAEGEGRGKSSGKVTVTFGWDLMDRINADAEAKGTSFAAQVRAICRGHYQREDTNKISRRNRDV